MRILPIAAMAAAGLLGFVVSGPVFAGDSTVNQASVNVVAPQIVRDSARQTGQAVSSAASESVRDTAGQHATGDEKEQE